MRRDAVKMEMDQKTEQRSIEPPTADLQERSNDESIAKTNSTAYLLYVFLPLIFMAVTLLGGLRLSGADNSLIFTKPPLVCLIFASVLLLLFFRAGTIDLNAWLRGDLPVLTNIANGMVLFTLFAASTQLFNSLLPEAGLPFWIVAFCFLWTLWNNLFADFDTRKLFRSLGALFALAFVAKYLMLANLTAPSGNGWLQSIIENPAKEAFTWAFDLPRFSAGTGYIQFFTAALYLIGLYLLPQRASDSDESDNMIG